jgi:uncharacterized protein YdaT
MYYKETEKKTKIISIEVPLVDDKWTDQRLVEIDMPLEQSDLVAQEENMQENTLNEEQISGDETVQPPESLKKVSSHPLSNVIENSKEGVRTRSGLNQMIAHCAFVS